jgi:hypothetical protein
MIGWMAEGFLVQLVFRFSEYLRMSTFHIDVLFICST